MGDEKASDVGVGTEMETSAGSDKEMKSDKPPRGPTIR